MLDIVMVAHQANYEQMAHRALNPVATKTDTSVRGSLQAAVDLVPLAGKVILSLEGGKHHHFEAAEAYLSSQNLPWQILHNDEGVTSYHEALLRAIEHCTSAMLAIVPPWCEIRDALWVQRMTWVLSNDQRALLCTTGPEQGPAKDLAPFIATARRWPGGEIIVGRRAELSDMIRLTDPNDFYTSLALAVARNGWRLWSHPGIRFECLAHEDHYEARQKARQ